jgi:hypothetical protein
MKVLKVIQDQEEIEVTLVAKDQLDYKVHKVHKVSKELRD